MSLATVAFLVTRLRFAESRWDDAMRRPGYRDDPDESPPFTEEDWGLYGWADSWRLLVHKVENELDALPESASARARQFAFSAQEPTFVEPIASPETLASHTRNLTKR